jgi:hypothetical protein
MELKDAMARTVVLLTIGEGWVFDAALVQIGDTALAFSTDSILGMVTDEPITPPIALLLIVKPVTGGPYAVREYLWDGRTLTEQISEAAHEQ